VDFAKPAEAPKSAPQPVPQPTRTVGLFDAPEPVAVSPVDRDEEEEILAETAEQDECGDEDQVEDAA
jgi:hypothetical protein